MDNKVMVNSPSNSADKGRTVEVARDAKEMPVNDIENYYSFPSSNNQAFETYSNRAESLSNALGNKDSVKG